MKFISIRCASLTHVSPRNHVFDGGQDQKILFAAATNEKRVMRPFAMLLWTLVKKCCNVS